MNNIKVSPVSGAVGVEIQKVDLSKELTQSTFSEIRNAFIEHGLIFFRDQDMCPENFIKFAKRWGKININRFFKPVEGYEQIAEVSKEPDQSVNIGGSWHTDHSYDLIPAMGSMLLAKEVPKIGGDTLFASMVKAYDNFSVGLKENLKNLRAVHSSRHVFGKQSGYVEDSNNRIGNPDLATQDAIHPVIITHPESKRKALYVNPDFTLNFEGWTIEESKPLLDFLYSQATKKENTTRFKWEPGTIAFWDNRSTWHYALNDYQGERRLMHRITIEGSPLS